MEVIINNDNLTKAMKRREFPKGEIVSSNLLSFFTNVMVDENNPNDFFDTSVQIQVYYTKVEGVTGLLFIALDTRGIQVFENFVPLFTGELQYLRLDKIPVETSDETFIYIINKINQKTLAKRITSNFPDNNWIEN